LDYIYDWVMYRERYRRPNFTYSYGISMQWQRKTTNILTIEDLQVGIWTQRFLNNYTHLTWKVLSFLLILVYNRVRSSLVFSVLLPLKEK